LGKRPHGVADGTVRTVYRGKVTFTRFRDTVAFVLQHATFSPPHLSPKFPHVPLVDGLWATKSEGVGLIARQLVSKIYNLCGPDPPTLGLQTDGRTTCNRNTALCTMAHAR